MAGRDLMVRIRHVLDAADAVARAGKTSGMAETGRVRLGVRMPPIGTPLQPLLAAWRTRHPAVALTLHELNDNEISIALAEHALEMGSIR
jgi:DNA-binding transcriptional LysR family regulator